jgi:D-alanyl-D-alanine carboxypeptidase, serine-type, PBP4 family
MTTRPLSSVLALAALLSFGLSPAPAAHAQQQKARKPAPVAPAAAPATPLWQRQIDQVLAAPMFKHASVGVLVRSLDTGKTLYAKNPDLALMPASNQKILTAAVALWALKPDFRYRTTIAYTGSIDRTGTLNGDLYLKGSGDPSLDSARLLALAQEVKARGIVQVNGRIVADASAFDDQTLGNGWQWDDESYYYSAQVAGLNCDRNILQLEITPGKNVDDPATVVVGGAQAMALGFANNPYVEVVNEVKTVVAAEGVAPAISVTRVRGRNIVRLTGTIPAGAEQKPVREEVTVEDPALFAASRFVELLRVSGVTVPPAVRRRVEKGVTPADAVEVAVSESQPLRELLKDFLKPSDNLYGEALLKTVGKALSDEGTARAGANALRDLLKVAAVEPGGLSVADGSGLSRMNTVTPRILVDVLTNVWQRFPADARDAFIAGLPEAGVDGTLRNRMKKTPAEGKVRAKTGTLTGVSALSGYLTTPTGQRVVFSIVMNQYERSGGASAARSAQDAIVLALMNVPR